MAEYGRVLCLFCKAGKERLVVERIREHEYGRAIFPQKTRRTLNKQSRRWEEAPAPLLPGYVFVYESCRADDPGEAALREALLSLGDVIRVLGYGSEDSACLRGRDLEFARWLWQTDGRIGKLKVIQSGDRIEIADGAFHALPGTIRRVDRRRGTCEVELDTSGVLRYLWLPYEMVEPAERKEVHSKPEFGWSEASCTNGEASGC